MPSISRHRGIKTFLQQRIANYFPSGMRGRYFHFSNLQQLIHPFAASIYELQINNQKVWHNFFYQTLDPTEIDVIYKIPRIFKGDKLTEDNTKTFNILGYWDVTSSSTLKKTDPNLDAFWYEPLPTRLRHIKNENKYIYPTREASKLKLGSMYDHYILGTHIEQDLFDNESLLSWAYSPPLITLSYESNNGWGGGPRLKLDFDNPLGTNINLSATATQSETGKTITFSSQNIIQGSNINVVNVTIGYQSVGSSVYSFAPSSQWERYNFSYTPPTATSTGIPFYHLNIQRTAVTGTDNYCISDYHFFKPNIIYDNTSIPYSMRDFGSQSPNWAYVILENGTNLFNTNTSFARGSIPATVVIEGINDIGKPDRERVEVLYNGTHRSSKLWREITGTRVDAIYPDHAKVSIQLQNYHSTSTIENIVDSFSTKVHRGPLFYSLENTSGTSFLGYGTFPVDNLFLLVDGYNYIQDFLHVELLDTNGASHSLTDIKFDMYNQLIYALKPTNTSIYIYEPYLPWPSKEKIELLKQKTVLTDMSIAELEENQVVAKRGSAINLEAIWKNRGKRLLKNRWTLYKPGGTIVGLTIAGGEVSINSNYFVSNQENTNIYDGEYRYHPQKFDYIATDYGDHVVELEAHYLDDNEGTNIQVEKDYTIFTVAGKKPLTVLPIPTIKTNPLGIDFDPYGNIKVAYTTSNNTILLEETFSRHWDYYMEDVEQNIIYLRESYLKVLLTEFDELVACDCTKKVLIVTAPTVALTISDIENGHIVLNTTTNAIDATLPDVGLAQDGFHSVFKRWGVNLGKVYPGAGATIDALTVLPLVLDKDSETLTYVHGLTDWNRN